MSEDSNSTFSRLFASGGIVFIGLAINYGMGFFTRALIARVLGPGNYGVISLGISLLMMTTVIVVIGVDTGVGRYLPRYEQPEFRRGVLVSAYQIVVPLSIVIGLVVAFLAEPISRYAFHNPGVTPIIRIFGLTIPFSAFIRLTVGSTRGLQQPRSRVYIQNIALPVARIGFVAVVLLLGFRSIGVSWAYAVAYGSAAALSLFYLIRYTPLFERVESRSMHRELLVFSLPLMVTTAMYTIFQNIDIFMIGYFLTEDIVGIYDVAYRLPSLLRITLTAFGFLFLPTISKLHTNGESGEMRQTYRTVTKWIFLTSLPIALVLMFYPELFIAYTFGGEFVAGSSALTILAIGFFIHSFIGLSGEMLTAIGKPRTIMYDSLLVAAVNILLNLFLIPRYSMIGAAIATTVGYIVMDSLYLSQVYREIGTHPFSRGMLLPGAVALAVWSVSYGILRAVDLVVLPAVIIVTVLFAVLYVVIVLRFGAVEPEEAALLGTFERRFDVDLDIVRTIAKRLAG
jgi:O-antigen/teichoic acid export membrane protein